MIFLKKVSINIVTWNSSVYLPFCLNAIFQQTYRDFNVLIIDNASSDGTLDYLQTNYPKVKILRNTQNLGYARAHNQGIKLTKSEYILIMNPDVILTPNYLKNVVEVADRRKDMASFGGKLLKFHFKPQDLREIEFTDKIDCVGIQPLKSRKFVNLGEGQAQDSNYQEQKEIFGATGALLFLRRNDLENVRIIDEYFDEDFYVYKEDIDLAWRLQLFGYRCLYLPSALAFHHRQAQALTSEKLKEVIISRRSKAKIVNYYSYRNHLFLLLKNEFLSQILWYIPQIFWFELKKFVYLLFFETSTLRAYMDLIKLLPKMLRKRKLILKNKKKHLLSIKKWFI